MLSKADSWLGPGAQVALQSWGWLLVEAEQGCEWAREGGGVGR